MILFYWVLGIAFGYLVALGRVAQVMARSLEENWTLLRLSDAMAAALIPRVLDRAITRKVKRDRSEQSDDTRTP